MKKKDTFSFFLSFFFFYFINFARFLGFLKCQLRRISVVVLVLVHMRITVVFELSYCGQITYSESCNDILQLMIKLRRHSFFFFFFSRTHFL